MTLREKVAKAKYEEKRARLLDTFGDTAGWPEWGLLKDTLKEIQMEDYDAVIAMVLEEAAKVCQQLGRVHREKGNIPGTWSFVGCEDCAAAIRALTQEGRDGQPRRTLDEMRGMFEDAYKHNRTGRDD